MPSPFEEMFAAQGTPLLMEHMGDPDIRQQRKADNFNTNWPVRGIWQPDPPNYEGQSGQKMIWTGRLTIEVDADVPLLETDQWVINEETWQVDKAQGGIGTAQMGLRIIYLKRVETIFTKSAKGETK